MKCATFCIHKEVIMKHIDVFSARDLRINAGTLIKDAESGKLSLITKHGRPTALTIPFDASLLELGVHKSLAMNLFKQKVITLSQAAKISKVTISDFIELLKDTDITVSDYSEDELQHELAILLSD